MAVVAFDSRGARVLTDAAMGRVQPPVYSDSLPSSVRRLLYLADMARPPHTGWRQGREIVRETPHFRFLLRARDGLLAFWTHNDKMVSPGFTSVAALAYWWADKYGYDRASMRRFLWRMMRCEPFDDEESRTIELSEAARLATEKAERAYREHKLAKQMERVKRIRTRKPRRDMEVEDLPMSVQLGSWPPDELVDQKMFLERALPTLPAREAGVVRLRLASNSLDEAGEAFGLSRERTRQIQDRALRRLEKMWRKCVP